MEFVVVTQKKNKLISFGINVLFLMLYFAFGQVRHGTLDDYFMSSVLTGAYGSEYDVHLYFVNAAYGYFLRPFYWLFPKVGWYFIFELAGTFCAFWVYAYILIKKIGCKYGVPLSLLLLAALTPDFYFQLSFTQCATAYTSAGILLFVTGISENRNRFLLCGGLTLLAGSIMRWPGFLLGLPYLLLLSVARLPKQRRLIVKSMVALCVIMVAIWGVRQYDRNLFVQGEYKYYAEYQPIRAYFGDGAFYDRESTYDELEERGMSGNDFNLLKSWMFYDTDVFYKDSLEPIKAITRNNLYEPNQKRVIAAFFLAVSNAFTRTNGWCWVILCILLMLSNSRKAALYPWFSLAFVAMSIGYLLLLNRLVYRVETGIWLYAIVSAIPFLDVSKFRSISTIKKYSKMLYVGTALVAIFFTIVGISSQDHLKKEASLISSVKTPEKWTDFLKYAKGKPDDVFLLSFDRYKEMGELRNPPYIAIGPGDFGNIFSWGYWNIHLPAMKKDLAKRGVKNPIKDVVHNNVYVLENNEGSVLDVFYVEHYHKSLQIDTVKTFGDLVLLKYRLPKDSSEDSYE